MANGHPDAAHYPIGTVMDEVAFVTEREGQRIASEAIAFRAAAAAVVTEQGGKHFDDLIKRLTGE